jgi:hypothetical protein
MRWAEVVIRVALVGIAVGVAVGGALGTALMPIVGTAFVASLGGVYGGVLGAIEGLLYATLVRWLRPDPVLARIFGAAVSAAGLLLLTTIVEVAMWQRLVVMVAGAGAGALLGPVTAYGVRIEAFRRWWRPALVGLVVAALVGGVVGLILGLRYPPTLGVAIVEGGYLGGVCEIVVVVVVSLVRLPLAAARPGPR